MLISPGGNKLFQVFTIVLILQQSRSVAQLVTSEILILVKKGGRIDLLFEISVWPVRAHKNDESVPQLNCFVF